MQMTTSKTIRHRDSKGRFCKAPASAPKPRKVVVKVPEAPKVEAIPAVGFSDLVMSRTGQPQLPLKVWSAMIKTYDVPMVRTATWVVSQVKLGLTLDKAMLLVSWPKFRPFMVPQLGLLKKHPELMEVLEWSVSNPGWGWKEGYSKFPGSAGPLGKLIQLLDFIRKEGKTSPKNVQFLGEAVQLIGWIS